MDKQDRNQCRGCAYWRPLSHKNGPHACHYCTDCGHSRTKDGARCLSKAGAVKRPRADDAEQDSPRRAGAHHAT